MRPHERHGDGPAIDLAAGSSPTTLLDAGSIGRLVTIADVIDAIAAAVEEQVGGQISPAERASLLGGSTLLMAAASETHHGVAGKLPVLSFWLVAIACAWIRYDSLPCGATW